MYNQRQLPNTDRCWWLWILVVVYEASWRDDSQDFCTRLSTSQVHVSLAQSFALTYWVQQCISWHNLNFVHLRFVRAPYMWSICQFFPLRHTAFLELLSTTVEPGSRMHVFHLLLCRFYRRRLAYQQDCLFLLLMFLFQLVTSLG